MSPGDGTGQPAQAESGLHGQGFVENAPVTAALQLDAGLRLHSQKVSESSRGRAWLETEA